jgi:GxxExxY protein
LRGMLRDPLTERVIGLAIEVHRTLGPGLLESAYEDCLCHELRESALEYQRQLALPVSYKSVRLESGFKIDILIQRSLVLELKAVEQILPVHEAQLLTYLKLGGFKTGLLLNFHVAVLKDGIKRMVL